jgi:hypothetical protein
MRQLAQAFLDLSRAEERLQEQQAHIDGTKRLGGSVEGRDLTTRDQLQRAADAAEERLTVLFNARVRVAMQEASQVPTRVLAARDAKVLGT